MGENKRSSSPHFNPVRAQRRLSPWRRQPPRATVGVRPSQGEGRGIGQRGWPHSLNFHSWRHMGQCCCTCCAFSHLRMQCMWKQCEHWPHTSGQSSPGTLPVGGTRGPVSHPEHRTSPTGEACPRWPQGSERTGTVRAAAIEGHPADATVLVVGYPEPSGHAVPAFDLHPHGARSLRGGKRPPGCAESAELRHLEAKEGVSPRGSSVGNSGSRKAVRAVCKGAGAEAGSSGSPGGPVLVLRQHRTSAPAYAEGLVGFL